VWCLQNYIVYNEITWSWRRFETSDEMNWYCNRCITRSNTKIQMVHDSFWRKRYKESFSPLLDIDIPSLKQRFSFYKATKQSIIVHTSTIWTTLFIYSFYKATKQSIIVHTSTIWTTLFIYTSGCKECFGLISFHIGWYFVNLTPIKA
jgi:hypothetical protein